ncbi:MAG: hypothetical protein E7072_07140 [Bacteroidales bacterium]|nr:hypothetical protein [Bacteroidales bacterium]
MKKSILIIIAAFASCIVMAQQLKIWENGIVIYERNISNIDSITFTAKTDSTLIPEKTKKFDAGEPLPGLFSIGYGTTVRFARGNVLYQPSSKTWEIAQEQYVTGWLLNNENQCEFISDTLYTGWIDLFSQSTTSNYYGVTDSENEEDYDGEFVDWGTNFEGNWITISAREWQYIMSERPAADTLWALASIRFRDDLLINGVIILPDNLASTNISFPYNPTAENFEINVYDEEEFRNMENIYGVVFLPYSDIRKGDRIIDQRIAIRGRDDSSIELYEGKVVNERFIEPSVGCNVRLAEVIRTSNVKPEFSVSDSVKVEFSNGNVQYQPSTKKWRFAPNQWETAGYNNINIIDTTYNGWIDLFSKSTSTNYYGVTTDYDEDNEYENLIDWGTNFEGEWYTMNLAESIYLFDLRIGAKGLRTLATVNGVRGMIILPDIFINPGVQYNFTDWEKIEKNGEYQDTTIIQELYEINIYNEKMWSMMEEAGAVFLPAAGHRSNSKTSIEFTNVIDHNLNGCYHLKESNIEFLTRNYTIYKKGSTVHGGGLFHKSIGQSVRLIRKIK